MRRNLKKALALFGFYILLLAAGDGALRLLFLVKDRVSPDSAAIPTDDRAYLAAYEGVDFDPVAMWREIKAGTAQWLSYQPYTVWTRKPIAGEYINVDDEGYRVTTDNSEDPNALRIWMVGGSTTWGMGVPDRYTVPSQLSRLFNEAGVPTRILNLGHTGFVSTQELLTLVRELQRREPPDLFIVYDGLNEGLGVSERPDLPNPHYLMGRISALFESRQQVAEPSTAGALRGLLETTGYYRLAASLRSRLAPVEGQGSAPAKHREFVNDSDVAAVAARSARILLENYGLMSTLGAGYDFPCFFFFQPQPGVGAKPLDESEVGVLAKVADNPEESWVLEFSRAQRRLFRELLAAGQGPPNVHDLSDLFADVEQPLYLDWAHLSPVGNRLVAERLFGVIGDRVGQGGLWRNEPDWAARLAGASAALMGEREAE